MVDRSLIRVGAKVRVNFASRAKEHSIWRTIVAVHPCAGSANGTTIDVAPGTRRKLGRPSALTVGIDIGWIAEVRE